jgi:hypothetical protein
MYVVLRRTLEIAVVEGVDEVDVGNIGRSVCWERNLKDAGVDGVAEQRLGLLAPKNRDSALGEELGKRW